MGAHEPGSELVGADSDELDPQLTTATSRAARRIVSKRVNRLAFRFPSRPLYAVRPITPPLPQRARLLRPLRLQTDAPKAINVQTASPVPQRSRNLTHYLIRSFLRPDLIQQRH